MKRRYNLKMSIKPAVPLVSHDQPINKFTDFFHTSRTYDQSIGFIGANCGVSRLFTKALV